MHPLVKIYDIILPTISDFFSFIVFYAILRKSTPKMKFIRPLLLKTVVLDVVLTQIYGWGWAIEQYYPIPAARLTGFFKFFGTSGGMISFCTSNSFLIASSLVVYECIAVRLAIAYDINWLLDSCTGWRFLIWQLMMLLIYASLLIPIIPANSDPQDLWTYAVSIDATKYLSDIDFKNDPIIFMNFDNPKALPFMLLACAALTLYLIIGYFCAFLTHRKLCNKSEAFSEETRRLQRSLTVMLVAQISFPVLFLTGPYMVLLLVNIAGSAKTKGELGAWDPHAVGWNWIMGAWILYPLLNSSLTLVIIKPYRLFFLSLIGKVTGLSRLEKTSTIHVMNSSASAL